MEEYLEDLLYNECYDEFDKLCFQYSINIDTYFRENNIENEFQNDFKKDIIKCNKKLKENLIKDRERCKRYYYNNHEKIREKAKIKYYKDKMDGKIFLTDIQKKNKIENYKKWALLNSKHLEEYKKEYYIKNRKQIDKYEKNYNQNGKNNSIKLYNELFNTNLKEFPNRTNDTFKYKCLLKFYEKFDKLPSKTYIIFYRYKLHLKKKKNLKLNGNEIEDLKKIGVIE